VIIMTVIRFGFHFSLTLMVGTFLKAVVFTLASGAWNNWRIRNIDNTTTLTFAISGVIGIIVGSIVFSSIAHYGPIIDLIICLAFLWPALGMLNEGIPPRKNQKNQGERNSRNYDGQVYLWLIGRIPHRCNRSLRGLCLSFPKCLFLHGKIKSFHQ
jgi:uncharacterized membrane protein YfcA